MELPGGDHLFQFNAYPSKTRLAPLEPSAPGIGWGSEKEGLKFLSIIVPIDSYGNAGNGKVDGLNCIVASNSGLPAVSMVDGYSNDSIKMPIAMELIGRQYAESTLLEIASAYEKSGVRWISPSWINGDKVQSSLSKLSIQELNRLFTKIGWVTYNQILRNGKREDLTAERFKKIVTSILPLSK